MFFELLLFSLLGVLVGFLTGLLPGLHPNSVFILVLSLPFLAGLRPEIMIVFITALAVSNTFTDFLPSILFGAPDPDTALGILPGHTLLMEGRGYEALFLTVVGGISVTLLTVVTFPLLLFLIPAIYTTINPYMHVVLGVVVLWMVVSEKSKAPKALVVFLLAGTFGLISLRMLPPNSSLFPGLTGLFAFPVLLTSWATKSVIPKQKSSRKISCSIHGPIIGWLGGMLAGILPGVGSAQAGTLAAQAFKAKVEDFLSALGGINTANILFTFTMLYTLGKTRSGAALALSQVTDAFTPQNILLLVSVALMACFMASLLTLRAGRFILNRMEEINYTKLNLLIIILLSSLVIVFSGLPGVLVAATGTLTGLLTIFWNIRRSHLMGFLILPTILFFSGLDTPIYLLLNI